MTVLRVFEARAKPGKAQELREKFAVTSVAVVDGKPGNLGHLAGTNVSTGDHDLVFISVWDNLESIKTVCGEAWQSSFLPEGYDALIESCRVYHLDVEGRLQG